MDFALNKEQEMFRSVIRKYLNSVEQTKAARHFMEGDNKPFQEAWQGLAEIGAMAINVPEEFDGADFGQLDTVPALEEIGRALLPGVYLETVGLAVPLLKKYGTEEQKAAYLPEIAAGTRSVSLAWLEPETVGYEIEDIQMKARIDEDTICLTGSKTLVPDGNVADTFIIPVRTAEDCISLVIVDVKNVNGITARELSNVDETRGLAEVTFENVKVSANQVLGPLHEGWSVLQEGLLHLNASVAASMVGGIERVVEMAAEYAITREQFGQPIGRFQAIKHRIAEMKIDFEMARSLTYYANWAIDHNAPDRVAAVAGARAFAAEAYIRTSGHNIQIHGGIGFTTEIDCHMYLKRARSLENYLGSVQDYHELVTEGLGW